MNNQSVSQKGFTLIELMIVIAIIGILMAYAIPAYHDYVVRSQAGECVSIMNGAKVGVSERWNAINSLGAISSNSTAFIAASASITGANVSSVTVSANGIITCTFSSDVPELNSNTITLSPTDAGGSLEWTCTAASLSIEHRPGSC